LIEYGQIVGENDYDADKAQAAMGAY